MEFDDFFMKAFGKENDNQEFSHFEYQRQLAIGQWPDLLDVPTGMGKTAAVTLAWLWKRGWRKGGRSGKAPDHTPRRLVWCLPMRVLVEQTEETIRSWLINLCILGEAGTSKVSVHVLMGGASDGKTWAEYPEEDVILIGTQDMLLSRALMRGYGMSRYHWPVHFALLHNDCLWVFDEVQLMGSGLATSAQLEAFRRSFASSKESRSLWVSATLNRDWLNTVDFKPHLNSLATLSIGDEDRRLADHRLSAEKNLRKLEIALTKSASSKDGLTTYLRAMRDAILKQHDGSSQTLVIVNRVDRAQQLFGLLREARPEKPDLLLHARFRALERAEQNMRLRNEVPDRIVISTQAIEAGVDISSKTMITELAPWASMVQRFGRCNRYGEHNGTGANILWIDIEDDKDLSLPYDIGTLSISRDKLNGLNDASPQNLPRTDTARPLTAVLRRKDLLDLFNTDPDLSGFDVDVSDYIRDSDTPGVHVFWRDFKDDPNRSGPEGKAEGKPSSAEICPISMSQASDIHKRGAWCWDSLGDERRNGRWVKLNRKPRPGMTLLLRAGDGGYDAEVGFDASLKKVPVQIVSAKLTHTDDAYGEDWRSQQNIPVALADHLGHVAAEAKDLCDVVGETTHRDIVVRSSRWHDLGKAHQVFDATMHGCDKAPAGFLAKSPCSGHHSRKFFRHEVASMLSWLAQHHGESDADLIAYLILSHHGKVRMSLRAMPTEEADKGVRRFARGIWEGDVLPAFDFDGEHSATITLKLALMEIGEGAQGPSWTERSLKLLEEQGPFRLAWLETLVRVADWRASAKEQKRS
jgi:CRISPR-associated endonuclease/helicase Cas3